MATTFNPIAAATSITKLQGKANYTTWKADLKRLLMVQGLWEILTGDELAPVKDEWGTEYGKELKAYRLSQQKLGGFLRLTVSPVIESLFDKADNKDKSATELFDLLKAYDQQGFTELTAIANRITRSSSKEFSSIKEYIVTGYEPGRRSGNQEDYY